MIFLSFKTEHPTLPHALRFEAVSGEIVLIKGASGCGKSTLLGQIWGSRGLPEGGALSLNYEGHHLELGPMSPAELAYMRPRLMGYVEQSPIVLKRDVLSTWFASDDPRLEQGLAALDLSPALLKRRAGEVSGGERQRFILLRTILSDCPVLLLDEPFTGLDGDRIKAVAQLLRNVALAGRLVIMTGHDDYHFVDQTWRL